MQAPRLSTGDASTLGNYRKLCVAVFGEDSKPVQFLDNKIKDSTLGEDEPVLAAESQMIYLLATMALS